MVRMAIAVKRLSQGGGRRTISVFESRWEADRMLQRGEGLLYLVCLKWGTCRALTFFSAGPSLVATELQRRTSSIVSLLYLHS